VTRPPRNTCTLESTTVGATWRSSKSEEPEAKRMTAAPKSTIPADVACGGIFTSQARPHWGEADVSWEETGRSTRGSWRGTGPSSSTRINENNVGKDHLPAGIGDNLRRRSGIGTTEAAARVLVWRMGSYEQERGGNSLRGGRSTTPCPGNTRYGQRSPGTWRSRLLSRIRGTDPGQPVPSVPRRVCCQSHDRRGVCEPTLKPPGWDAGQWRKAKPPNRNREIRPSGMTTGASGDMIQRYLWVRAPEIYPNDPQPSP
jgi:hypothetical protein